jgi:hypothetical protein
MTVPLRILVLAANPLSTDELALEAEHRLLRNKMSDNSKVGNCELLVQWAARFKDLKQSLTNHQPHVVHFAGHGTRDGICLEDDDGNSSPVAKEQLADLFRESGEHLRLVVLNACFSAVQVEALSQVVDYVVGTTAAVADDVAVRFTAHFYEALATGETVREAHYKSQIGLAQDRQERLGQYELLVRSGTDETMPLLPPMLPPIEENIQENEVENGDFGELLVVNASRKGAGRASSATQHGRSERNVSNNRFVGARAKKATFINNEE